MSKIILFIATSLDGFIADSNGGVDWLPQPQNDAELEAVGYTALLSRIDTILMGRRSYEQILGFGEWAWPDKRTYVFTNRPLETAQPNVSATCANPVDFVRELPAGRDVWLLGGACLAQSFARQGLIDEIILTITPQTLGAGIPLGIDCGRFTLKSERALMDGMIQKVYLQP